MRSNLESEFAKWLNKNGDTKRKDLPPKFANIKNAGKRFSVWYAGEDADGYQFSTENDIFFISEENRRDYKNYRKKQIHEFRDWLEPTGIVIANLIALAALIVSIIAINA